MDTTREERPASLVHIRFKHETTLSPHQISRLLDELVAGLPLPPDSVEAGPSGHGAVLYGFDETLTINDLTEVVMWLRRHPRLREVWWEAAISIDATTPARE